LGARLDGIEEVAGSNPAGSTTFPSLKSEAVRPWFRSGDLQVGPVSRGEGTQTSGDHRHHQFATIATIL
jgi:hypothetical protein